MSLQIGPLELLEALERAPREMAVFRAVQDAMRTEIEKRRPKPGAAPGK